ncbi:MAG: 4Fe-4S dicluster domain-containing protein [Marinilabiliales bacterium]|nr:4Fe-4S dicluster domain-containing protein [Marinilabiliales bacterium]
MDVVNPYLADELKKYGGDDFTKCFNCGNCTAVCSLSERSSSFPRMMVRYGMLGLRKEILASSEPWLCYACGDCTGTCPRQADPGHYMATLRRYSIAQFEPTGLTRMLFKSNPFSIIFTILLAFVLSLFLFTLEPGHEVARWIFERLPFAVIHDMGMVIFIITGLAAFIGLFNMIRALSGNSERKEKESQVNGTRSSGWAGGTWHNETLPGLR